MQAHFRCQPHRLFQVSPPHISLIPGDCPVEQVEIDQLRYQVSGSSGQFGVLAVADSPVERPGGLEVGFHG